MAIETLMHNTEPLGALLGDASDIIFDNSGTSLESTDVEGALKEIDSAIPNVVDNLTSTSSTDALSAKQGKVLNDKIESYSSTNQTMTGISVAFARKGPLKYLRFSDNGTSSAINSGESLGIISDNSYRPSVVLDIRDTYSNMRFTIETDGSIIARQNVSSGSILRGSFIYF